MHRLDREARGLVLLAHGRAAAAAFSKLFRTGGVEKRYRAVVHGLVGSCGETRTLDAELDGKSAQTLVTVSDLDVEGGKSTLDILLLTGRYHQIRRHLSAIGHPLVGDDRYGPPNRDRQPLQLTAYELAFRCPFSGRDRRFTLEDVVR